MLHLPRAHVVHRGPQHLLIQASSAVRIPIDEGLVGDGLAHARVADRSSTSLSWLSNLAVLTLSMYLTSKLLGCLQELSIVDHLSLELHHHGHSLLINILEEVCQRVFKLIKLRSQHQVALVELDFKLSDGLSLLFSGSLSLEKDVFDRDDLILNSIQDSPSLFILKFDLCQCHLEISLDNDDSSTRFIQLV